MKKKEMRAREKRAQIFCVFFRFPIDKTKNPLYNDMLCEILKNQNGAGRYALNDFLTKNIT